MDNVGWLTFPMFIPEPEEIVDITYRVKDINGKYHYHIARAFYEDGTVIDMNSKYTWDDDFLYYAYDGEYHIKLGWFEASAFRDSTGPVEYEVVAWKYCDDPYVPEEEQ